MSDLQKETQFTHKKFTKRTKEDVLQELQIKNPTIELVGEYINTQVKTEWKCKTCGQNFHNSPSKLLVGRGCPDCGKKRIGDKLRKPHEIFVKEISEIMPTITILGQYNGWATKVECRCNICENIFLAIPGNLRKNEGCPKCGLRKLAELNRKTHEQFIEEMAKANSKVRIIGKYESDDTKIECKCLDCFKQWKALPTNLRKGHGCPRCARNQTSFMERAMLLFLERAIGENNVLSRNKDIIGKELDIHIPQLKIAIEPGNWSLHKPRIQQDLEKYNLCKRNNIRLITIYDCFNEDEINIGLDRDDLWTYKHNLGDRGKRVELVKCIKRIFATIDVPYLFSEDEENEILTEAKLSTSRKKTSDIVKELAEINSNIELLDHYEDTKTKMNCRCKKCNHVWGVDYEHLIRRKHGCPECNSNKRKVVNLDTGVIFNSITEAASSINLTHEAVRAACTGHVKVCAGHHWAYISSLTPEQIAELRTKFSDTFNL